MVFLQLKESGTGKDMWVNKNHVNLITKINVLDPKFNGPKTAQAMVILAGNPIVTDTSVDEILRQFES